MASHHPDDLKYIQKYNELKRKVKEIEIDNDRLQVKVLKTKKNIQRLRIERAILYDRLASMPQQDPNVQSSSYPYSDHPARSSGSYPTDVYHAAPPPLPPPPLDKDRRRLDPPHHPAHLSSPPARAPSPVSRLEHYPPGPPPPSHVPADTDQTSARRPRRHPGQHTPTLPPASVNYSAHRSPEHPHAHPAHPHYPPPRRDLDGPGLPPMRTHPNSPVPPHPHNGYPHPMQHAYPPPDDRGWERERDRDYTFPPIRDREPIPNGYRDLPGPPPPPPGLHPHRYDVSPHAHAAPPQNGSPETLYSGRPRGASQSSVRDFPPPPPPSHAYDYEYDRRRSFAEISDERGDREQKRRNSMDDYEARRRDRGDAVPRVREGEAME